MSYDQIVAEQSYYEPACKKMLHHHQQKLLNFKTKKLSQNQNIALYGYISV